MKLIFAGLLLAIAVLFNFIELSSQSFRKPPSGSEEPPPPPSPGGFYKWKFTWKGLPKNKKPPKPEGKSGTEDPPAGSQSGSSGPSGPLGGSARPGQPKRPSGDSGKSNYPWWIVDPKTRKPETYNSNARYPE